MNTVSVSASQCYNVLIGSGLLSEAGLHIAMVCGKCRAAIISDSNVWPLYGNIVEHSLTSADIDAVHYVFPAGEASKNANTYVEILNFLAESKITRSDILIALGGGVVGDITGFAAATFLRGIGYIQIPTSLLAMVDSSVGGKTAIDLAAGKNLAGAFKQPRLVLCDTDVLSTLPREWFLDGCAEVIKYSVLYDAELFRYLLDTGPGFDRETVITKCVTFKRDVVRQDEFDTGSRQKLNLGHTIGHGIEAGSQFTLSHGKAVAAGMAIVSWAAYRSGICDSGVPEKVNAILHRFQLPISTALNADVLFSAALSDKKRSGSTINLIVPKRIGCCEILPMPVEALKTFIEAGL